MGEQTLEFELLTCINMLNKKKKKNHPKDHPSKGPYSLGPSVIERLIAERQPSPGDSVAII